VSGGGPDTHHPEGWEPGIRALDNIGRFCLWGGVELRTWVIALGIGLSLTACTPSRMSYLREAVNQATQDEITTTLGPPQAARVLANGETVWRYESYQGDLLCLEYVLRFDQAGILRHWTRQRC
jgi:hypothetical protein